MRIARNVCSLMLLVVLLGALAFGQAVVTDDANTSSLYPTTNFGGSIALLVGSGSNTYIKLGLANLGAGVTGSNVSKATLILYTDAVLTSGTMDVYQVNGSWSEGKITWNTAPALGTKLFSAVSVSGTGYLSLDLTSTVQAWLNGTLANNGIALVPTSGSNISVSFDSKENVLTSHTGELPLVLVSAGPQGAQGPQGPQGLQGIQGPKGDTGATGAIGPQGPKGDTGATGAIGPQGPKGDTGATGAQGPQGLVGPMGVQGVPGADGAAGPAGPAGINGVGFNFRNVFSNSPSYAVNDVVSYNGSSYVAISANSGPDNMTPDANPAAWSVIAAQGATGAAGAQGLQGIQGPKGDTGATGPSGPAGATGPAGPQGPVGPMPTGAALVAAANLFGPTQTITGGDLAVSSGNIDLPQTTSSAAGVIKVAGNPFVHDCCGAGSSNLFVGTFSGTFYVTGLANTALGYNTLASISTGQYNTAIGTSAMSGTTGGSYNAANGYGALFSNNAGSYNAASGAQALGQITGSYNAGMGYKAGAPNFAFGGNAGGGSNNTFVGANSKQGGSADINNATAVGAGAEVDQSNSLVLGSFTPPVNVGIGDSAPAARLTVAGQESTASGLGATIKLSNIAVGGNNWYFQVGATGTNAPAAAMTVGTDSVNSLTLRANGDVGIGTTAPDSLLTVNGTADKPGGGSWGTYSDRRLKTLDGSFQAGLTEVLKLNPVRYRYKTENALGIRDPEEHIGVVAQEVQQVIPEAVTQNAKGYLLVNNDPILWTMLNAIKEQQILIGKQQAQIDFQAAQVKDQRTQIVHLASRVAAMQAAAKRGEQSGSQVHPVKAKAPKLRD